MVLYSLGILDIWRNQCHQNHQPHYIKVSISHSCQSSRAGLDSLVTQIVFLTYELTISIFDQLILLIKVINEKYNIIFLYTTIQLASRVCYSSICIGLVETSSR